MIVLYNTLDELLYTAICLFIIMGEFRLYGLFYSVYNTLDELLYTAICLL